MYCASANLHTEILVDYPGKLLHGLPNMGGRSHLTVFICRTGLVVETEQGDETMDVEERAHPYTSKQHGIPLANVPECIC